METLNICGLKLKELKRVANSTGSYFQGLLPLHLEALTEPRPSNLQHTQPSRQATKYE